MLSKCDDGKGALQSHLKRAGGRCEPAMEALCCSSRAEGKKAVLPQVELFREGCVSAKGVYPMPLKERYLPQGRCNLSGTAGLFDITARLKEFSLGRVFLFFPKEKRKFN